MNFQNKVVLVTGAAQGIGAAIAARFIEDGAYVVLVDRDEAKLKDISLKLGKNAEAFVGDITNKSSLDALFAQIEAKHKRLDVLVNNAGVIRDGFVSSISEEDWDLVIDVNLKGAFLMCQRAFPLMKNQQYGKIVNIISRSWLGNIGQANYAASKGGLVSLTRTMALEFARYQINVNGVSPGFIDTPMTQGLKQEVKDRLLRMQPTGKMGKPQDIAAAVAFMASDEASFISGQILHVDGGKSCGVLAL